MKAVIKSLVFGLFFLLSACSGGSSGSEESTYILGGSGGGLSGSGGGNRAPAIEGVPLSATESQSYSFKPSITDADGDALSLAVQNKPEWLSFNASTGELSGTPASSDVGVISNLTITASDGKATSNLTFDLRVIPDSLEEAIRTGNAALVDDDGIFLDAALDTIEINRSKFNADLVELFNLTADGGAKSDGSSLTNLHWDPTHDAALLGATFGTNHPILVTNDVSKEGYDIYHNPLGVIGEYVGQHYMFLGSNPMRTDEWDPATLNDQMHQFLKNSLGWLSGKSDIETSGLNVVIAQMAQSYYFPDEVSVRKWLDEKFPGVINYNAADSCDGNDLSTCITASTDLLIISQIEEQGVDVATIVSTVKNSIESGVPVLYLHHDGGHTELGKALFDLFDVNYFRDNYWWRGMISSYNPASEFNQLPSGVEIIKALLQRIKNNSFTIDFTACDDKSCEKSSGYEEQFGEAADVIRGMITGLDKNKIRMFDDQAGRRLDKLLVLLGDSYRQDVTYPMDKLTTDGMVLLKSFFADHTAYNLRDINPAQADMGNFSRSNFSHITPVNKTIALQSKVYQRSAGVYALPGQTFTVRRTDSSAVGTQVFINTLRNGATHQFSENGYTRPRFLQTPWITVEKGETLSLTSPYGGPIQIGFDANDQDVSFEFTNVGLHPYWNGSEDDSDFEIKLAAGDYDWAELVTPGFEVHSKLDKMRESMSSPNWNTASSLAAAVTRYVHNLPHVLSGFQGPGIDVVSEIHQFATDNSWQVEAIDKVKHMNADQANCGYGCSGNPYDAYWAFSPIGHGDLHELGHGLEQSRFRFEGWPVHASTNPYSYHSKYHFYLDTGNDPDCQSLPFESLFNTLQASVKQADPAAYMQANTDFPGSWSHGATLYIQMMMSAQGEGVLTEGWHMLARLHMIVREFNQADNNESDWLSKRDTLGFSQYSLSEAKNIAKNDWLVIALSYVMQRDMRDYLTMWGFSFGSKAGDQVATFGYPAMPRNFYVSGAADYCKGLDKSALPVDGEQTWPL